MRAVTYIVIAVLFLAAGFAEAAGESVFELRQAYNTVVAEIDSVVRVMAIKDGQALDGKRLPDPPEDGLVPEGMAVVMIFWADDEAQVWVNDFLVGETRLTPVEVEVPSIYLQAQNRIRARCWDTDFVESGFMCGLYLRDPAGALHPIVVSDGQWEATEGRAMAITYAHPSPDIPGAEPIWGPKVFGVVELSTTFEGQAVLKAASQAGHVGGMQQKTQKRKMDYHRFLQHLVVLQGKRAELKKTLEAQTEEFAFPVVAEQRESSPGLTLGKAGPLKEAMSKPLAEQTQAWAKALPEKQQQLIYPERRALKGEAAATPESDVATGEVAGPRQLAYQQPEERGAAPPGARRGKQGEDRRGGKGQKGSGSESVEAGLVGGRGGLGRATRWGLLIPTLILGLYVGYVILNWDAWTGG
ncbi:MAG: hypothetical protein O7G87_09385 [bacterium]|nr:hypothetical protein [bacterium]